jgi:Ca2+-binding RTX toxin-like protein
MSHIGTNASENITANDSTVYALDGNDIISTTQGGPNIYGGEGNDAILNQGDGVGDLFGGRGHDTIHGGEASDDLYGEAGNDLLVGGEFSHSAALSDGLILLVAGEISGNDVLYGGNGSDGLYGLDGNDVLYGGDDNDGGGAIGVAHPFTLNQTFLISSGLFGGSGDDYLDGGRGNDFLDGGTGNDTMYGGEDNDTFVVDSTADRVLEGVGGGALDWVQSTGGYTLGSSSEVERLSTTDNGAATNFNLFGNEFAQEIWGNAGKNRINGLGGADVIKGYGGNDTFVYSSSAYSGTGAEADIIQDFEDYADDDTLDLSGFAGNLTFRGTGAIGGLNQVHIEQAGSHVLVQINAYGDLAPDVEILLANTNIANVTASDFIL